METRMTRGLEEAVRETNTKSLSILRNTMEALVDNFQQIANSIPQNPRLISYFSQTPGYPAYEAAKELARYGDSNNAIYTLGILYTATKNIVSPNGIIPLKDYFSKSYRNGALSGDDFFSLCRGLSGWCMVPFPSVINFSQNPVDLVFFIYPLPIQNRNAVAFVFFLVKEEYLRNMLEAANIGSNSIVAVLDFSSLLWVAAADLKGYGEELIRAARALDSRNTATIDIRSEKFNIIKLEGSGRLNYLVATPLSRYLGPVIKAKQAWFLAMLVIAILGISYSLAASFGNYRPIGRLADTLVETMPDLIAPAVSSEEARENRKPADLEWITARLESLKQTRATISSTLCSRQGLLRQQLIIVLLTHKGDVMEELRPMLQAAQIQLGGGGGGGNKPLYWRNLTGIKRLKGNSRSGWLWPI
jgi:hypothetical protein